MKPVSYIEHQIRYMCGAFKGRSGGSEAEGRCQDYIKAEMATYADAVSEQAFTVHPAAGWAWIIVAAVSGIVSIVLPLFATSSTALCVIAFCASVLATYVTVFQFLLGQPVLDRFLPARRAKNVYATVRPRGEIRQRVVFAGHADAAYEMTYSHQGGGGRVLYVALVALAGLFVTLVVNAVLLFRQLAGGGIALWSAWHWVRLSMLLFLPAFVRALFFFDLGRIVDGANDNLSGCAVAMAALRAFSAPQDRLSHTEVGCLITSSEECGLRGAHAFGQRYAREADGIRTVFIVLDTLREVEQLMVYPQGLNGLQPSSEEAAQLARAAAADLGLPLPDAPAFLGATDADALSQAGLSACAICGVDHMPQPYYHTRADNADNIDARCLSLCEDLCVAIGRRYDESAAGPLTAWDEEDSA